MGRHLGLLAVALLWVAPVGAQAWPWDGAADATTGVRVQRVSDGSTSLAQVSVPLAASASLSEAVDLHLLANVARSTGEDLADLSGLSDAQLAASYRQPLAGGEAVAGLRLAVPGGASRLSADEAETAFLVGQGFYGFQAPVYRRGLSLTPSATWARPLSERAAVGVGAALTARPAYAPLDGVDATFDPATELSLTAGVSTLLSNASELSVDATYVVYGSDTWGDVVYETGNALGLAGRWSRTTGPMGLAVGGEVVRRGRTDTINESGTPLGLDAAAPTRVRLWGLAQRPLSPRLSVSGTGGARYFSASEAFSSRVMLDLGLGAEVAASERLSLVAHLGATLGTVRGTDIGAGVRWSP